MTGSRESELKQAANILMDARRTLEVIDDLPSTLRPVDTNEFYAVQDILGVAMAKLADGRSARPLLTPRRSSHRCPKRGLRRIRAL